MAATPDTATRDIEPAEIDTAASRTGDDDFALVVGIDDYPRFRPLQPLQGAVADALTFYEWLCAPAGGRVDPARVRLITSTTSPHSLQTHIDDALEDLLVAADARGGGRRLYFYFSGHGAAAQDAVDSVALLLADWSKTRRRLALSSKSYTSDLASYGVFAELVVFLDCCRTEPPLVGRGITLTLELPRRAPETRTLIAYATELGGSAFEERSPCGTWRGVFTPKLLEILKRGVAAAELKDLLESAVNRGNLQHARVWNNLTRESRFGCSGALQPLHVTFSAERSEPVRLFDGFNREVAIHDPHSGPLSLPLPAGIYRLLDAAGSKRIFEHPDGGPVAF